MPDITASPVPVHTPPGVSSVNVNTVPEHTDAAPCMGFGMAFTVIIIVVKAPPAVYVTLATPLLIPVTIPVNSSTLAIELTTRHVPPPIESVNLVVLPAQMLVAPLITGIDELFTKMFFVKIAGPQIPVVVYEMITAPAETPVTKPFTTVATDVLPLLHIPPLAVSVNVIVEPDITLVGPVIIPVAVEFTVTITVALALQPFAVPVTV